MSGDGFDYTSSALADIAATLRNGTAELGAAGKDAPPAPDAGTSSDVVGDALAKLVQVAATAAGRMADAAAKIHANQGSYDKTENNNAGAIARQQSQSEDQKNFRGTDFGSPNMIYPG